MGITATPLTPEQHVVRRAPARWYRNNSLMFGLGLLALIVGLSLAAPLLTPFGPNEQDVASALAPPSGEHFLGTDQLGRDVWTRLLYGARTDLQIAFLAVLFSAVAGTFLGSIAGYFGGWTDTVIMRIVDIVRAFPPLVLIIGLAFVLGSGVASIYIAIAFVDWSSYARLTRGEILSVKNREYVLAARIGGLSNGRIISRHILPNVITQTVVFAMSDIVLTMVAIVTLGYLGLGVPPPTPDWGSMIAEGQNLLSTHWRLSTVPGIAIVVTGLSLSLIADGLADLLRPE